MILLPYGNNIISGKKPETVFFGGKGGLVKPTAPYIGSHNVKILCASFFYELHNRLITFLLFVP